MKYLEGIKRALAIVILACFFLPLSQCTTVVQENGKPDAKMVSKTEQYVPYKAIHFESIDEILVVSIFVWPLGFWALNRKTRSKRSAVLISLTELLCGIASLAYLAYLFLFWTEIKWAGIVVTVAFALSVLLSIRLILYHALREPSTP